MWRLPRGRTQSNVPDLDLATRSAMANPRLASSLRAALRTPELILSIDINALNYCRFSLVATGRQLAVAIPHTLESAYIDVMYIDLDTCQVSRAYSAIGVPDTGSAEALQESRAAIVMAVHLFAAAPLPASEKGQSKALGQGGMRLLLGYEDGRITLWRQTHSTPLGTVASQEGEDRYQAFALFASSDWQVQWTRAKHSDTGTFPDVDIQPACLHVVKCCRSRCQKTNRLPAPRLQMMYWLSSLSCPRRPPRRKAARATCKWRRADQDGAARPFVLMLLCLLLAIGGAMCGCTTHARCRSCPRSGSSAKVYRRSPLRPICAPLRHRGGT